MRLRRQFQVHHLAHVTGVLALLALAGTVSGILVGCSASGAAPDQTTVAGSDSRAPVAGALTYTCTSADGWDDTISFTVTPQHLSPMPMILDGTPATATLAPNHPPDDDYDNYGLPAGFDEAAVFRVPTPKGVDVGGATVEWMLLSDDLLRLEPYGAAYTTLGGCLCGESPVATYWCKAQSAQADGGADSAAPQAEAGPPGLDAATPAVDSSADTTVSPVDAAPDSVTPSADAAPDSEPPADSGTTMPSSDSGIESGIDSGMDAALPPGCTTTSLVIYVLDATGTLHSFDPDALTFTTIGTPSCVASANPASMAVDRGGTAWILTEGGAIVTASTTDASCAYTNFRSSDIQMAIPVYVPPGSPNIWTASGIGMTFVPNAPGSTDETLFIGGGSFGTLAHLDMATYAADAVGTFNNGAGGDNGTELISNNAGASLVAFFANPPAIAQIDKTTANVLSSTTLPIPNINNGFAASLWRGNYYLFTAQDGANNGPSSWSDVTVYNPTAGTTTKVLSQIGFQVVGTGQSTCTP